MLKSFFLISSVLFYLIISISLASNVKAQSLGWCNGPVARVVNNAEPKKGVSSDPRKTPKATFYVNVRNNKDFDKWKMKFECGVEWWQNNGIASLEGDSEIYREIPNTSGAGSVSGCEFHPGKHTIQVIGVNDRGVETPQCIARYDIVNQDKLCILDIEPKTNIISGEPIDVYGNNLSKDGYFGLFLDNNIVKANVDKDKGPTSDGFGPVQVEGKYLIPGKHKVSLKKYNEFSPSLALPGPIPPIEIVSKWGESLCIVNFTVGTQSNPGGVIGIGTSYPSQPAVASGLEIEGCNDPKNPGGIITAIGCIRTNPSKLAVDLLKFILGIGGGVAFLMMLLGAFQMLTSAGNPDTLRAGRERLTSALIGLLIVIFAVLLLQFIGIGILSIPGFNA